MTIASNPYIAGNPVHGLGKFIGRLDVLRDVEKTLRNPSTNAIVLYGQRRIGKTSVLLHIEQELAAKQEYTPIYFDLQDKASLPLDHVLYELAQRIAHITRVELPNRRQFDHGGRFFRDEFIPAAIEAAPEKGIVLLFDEFDVLDSPKKEKAGRTFFPYLREWMQSAQGIQFVFVVGRRPEELSTDTLPVFKTILSRRVSLMTREDTEVIVRQSEHNDSLAWSEDAVEKVWYWTQGHPFFTQLLCSEIWENAMDEESELVFESSHDDNSPLEGGQGVLQFLSSAPTTSSMPFSQLWKPGRTNSTGSGTVFRRRNVSSWRRWLRPKGTLSIRIPSATSSPAAGCA